MSWQIVQKSAYLTDFVELSKNLQQAVISAVKELEVDPITPRGDTIKKLGGYDNVWRYRIGDFRLIYAAAPQAEMVRLLAVGPRSSVYQRFNYPGWDAPGAAVEFGPELAAQPDWMEHPEWFQPPPAEKERLPRKLTPTLLSKWRVDPAYHAPLMRCLYADDLLEIPENKVPSHVLGHVMDGLYPPAVDRIASQPDQVLFDPEDLARYAQGTLAGFLLHLDEQQKPLTDWALAGPTLVKGGPGSGKSTVALYRIRAIIEHALADSGQIPSILFTTYTNSLINTSESLLAQLLADLPGIRPGGKLPSRIRVTTLHKTASWIARHTGKEFQVASDPQLKAAFTLARSKLTPRGLGDAHLIPVHNVLSSLRDDYLMREFEWVIEGQHCRSEDDYLAAERAGRGIAFTKETRQAVWKLYEVYQENLQDGGLLTWGQLIPFALEHVRSGGFSQRWDYVLVDEAQDLPPAALALCVELCREPSGVFLTADANQSLYNRGFRWGSVHQQLQVTGRTRILKRNYRSTRQIATAARQIMREVADHDGEVVEQEYIHVGQPPLIYAATGGEDQARWICQQTYQAARRLRLPLNAAVVLVYSSTVGEPLAAALSRQGLPAKFMASNKFDLSDPSIKVTTLHAAKGLEFPVVTVAHVEAGRLPRETDATDPEELETFLHAQRRLFYVGCTRAMRYLFVTYDRQIPSPFLEALTEDLWQKQEATADEPGSGPNILSGSERLELLIRQGESDTLEFKSTFQWDLRKGEKAEYMRDMVVKTVAAYLNSQGGTLLIGVNDNGDVLGIEQDVRLVTGRSLDKFELLLTRTVTDRIGAEFAPFVQVRFQTVGDCVVCIVEVTPAPKPCFVDEQKFYMRSGNASRELSMARALAYINMHWSGLD